MDERISEYYSYCGIHKKWQDKTAKDFTNDLESLEIVRKYLGNVWSHYKKGVGIYLYGSNGVGKTLLLNIVFKELIRLKFSARIISMSELITKFTSGWHNEETRMSLERTLKEVQFLGIEEIGKEYKNKQTKESTSVGLHVLDTIIRHRINESKPIWITSNVHPDQIAEMYSEDIASMLREVAIPLKVLGKDYRVKIAKKNLKTLGD